MAEFIEIEFIENQKRKIKANIVASDRSTFPNRWMNDSTIMSNQFDKLLTNEFKTFKFI